MEQNSRNQILDKVDLADHIQKRGVVLKRQGAHYSGKCPFHPDSTPSFVVYQRFFKCFGCQASGDVFSFEMRSRSESFPEALKSLGEQYGVEVSTRQRADPLKPYYEILEAVAAQFAENLQSPSEVKVREYALERGISQTHQKFWRIGSCTNGANLIKVSKRFPNGTQMLLELGLLKRSEKRTDYIYDFFRNRLMIPILDERSRVVGFGGRILPGDEGPKYLNSSESVVFKKRNILFNLNSARSEILKTKSVLVVEGYMDCIALCNAGIGNVVGVLGTELTQDHIQKLSRICDDVILCFDTDNAGKNAARRTFENCYALNLVSLKGLKVPGGKDPDEYLKTHSEGKIKAAEDFRLAMKDSESLLKFVLPFYVEEIEQQKRNDIEVLLRHLRKYLFPTIQKHPEAAVRKNAFEEIAKYLNVSESYFLKDNKSYSKGWVSENKNSSELKDVLTFNDLSASITSENELGVEVGKDINFVSEVWQPASQKELNFILDFMFLERKKIEQLNVQGGFVEWIFSGYSGLEVLDIDSDELRVFKLALTAFLSKPAQRIVCDVHALLRAGLEPVVKYTSKTEEVGSYCGKDIVSILNALKNYQSGNEVSHKMKFLFDSATLSATQNTLEPLFLRKIKLMEIDFLRAAKIKCEEQIIQVRLAGNDSSALEAQKRELAAAIAQWA